MTKYIHQIECKDVSRSQRKQWSDLLIHESIAFVIIPLGPTIENRRTGLQNLLFGFINEIDAITFKLMRV